MNRYTYKTAILEAGMIAATLVVAIPLYILVNLSIKSANDSSTPLLPPAHPQWSNYADAWTEANLGDAIFNSIAVTVISVACIVFISALASYPLVRLTWKLSRTAYWVIMAGLLLPFQVGMIPLYTTMRDLGLLGTIWSVILFHVGLAVPFSTFLYTGFLRALPTEYEEAAWIDGAGTFRTFWSVVFPLLKPITGTVIILNAIGTWNDFMTPLLYLSGSGHQTIPVALFGFVGQYISNWPLVFAGLVIGIAPVLIAYFILQHNIIKGFAGGLKG